MISLVRSLSWDLVSLIVLELNEPLLTRGLVPAFYPLATASGSVPHLRPCAILTASGSARKRSIAITPNSGPGARIMNA